MWKKKLKKETASEYFICKFYYGMGKNRPDWQKMLKNQAWPV